MKSRYCFHPIVSILRKISILAIGMLAMSDAAAAGDNRHEDEPATLEQVFSQCQYALGHHQTSSGKKSGGIRIGCNFKHVGGPTLEEVEDVFGYEWRNGWLSSPPPLHGVPARPTAPNGNARMIYNFDKESLRRSVEVTFDPNAEFSSFTLEKEER